MILVVVPMSSLAVARRMPVRCAWRWAAALFSALECVDWAACDVVERAPSSDELEVPELDELPPPEPKPIGPIPRLKPLPDVSLLVLNELPALTISLNASLKVARVEVSDVACWLLVSSCENASVSCTAEVSRRSNTATICCSPGAS